MAQMSLGFELDCRYCSDRLSERKAIAMYCESCGSLRALYLGTIQPS
ncbi:MAG: hypothetical protein VKL39_16120 [Leptolyngbyaceae bacterium]|nr:hypothetical protein [Leptolyngbyaceae bacterium]